jgi:hypothetical protein
MRADIKARVRCILLFAVLASCRVPSAFSEISLPGANGQDFDCEADGLSLAYFAPASADESRWSFSLESLFTFDVAPAPWLAAIGHLGTHPLNYNLATQILSARYRLASFDRPGFLRGDLEMSAGCVGSAVIKGPETYFVGCAFGLRYNFAQPRARLIPYVEARGGPGLTDARYIKYSQQQNFTFTYLVGAGLRYELDARHSLMLGAIDQHMSNAYTAKKNYGFDSYGINVGFQVRY